MNMMTMAMMEEAMGESFERHEIIQKYGWARPSTQNVFRDGFEDGFRAGAAWAMRQAENQTSPQAVGNISQYGPAVEEPEEES